MKRLTKSFQLFAIVILMSAVLTGVQAEKIIWVSTGDGDSLGNVWDQGFVELLAEAGYEVQREDSTMVTQTGETTLTGEQLDILESGDLVIVGRAVNSGSYNDPMGWNSVGKPMILTTAYLSRANRWQWFNSSDLLGSGSYKATAFTVEAPDHPIFAGVEAPGNVLTVLDTTVGTGNTSMPDFMDWGDGELLSLVEETGTVAIVHWQAEAAFHAETDQFAAAPRLFFGCGTRETTGDDPQDVIYGWGMENLTPEGEKMFLNAVAFMLGKEVGVAENPAAVPVNFSLEQNYPNPFNPTTTIDFSLSATSNVKLNVYNMLGQKVATLADQVYQAGTFSVTWDGRDSDGQTVESGVYLYKLKTENQNLTKKMLLMK